MFEHDGCKAYIFRDDGNWEYFISCNGEATYHAYIQQNDKKYNQKKFGYIPFHFPYELCRMAQRSSFTKWVIMVFLQYLSRYLYIDIATGIRKGDAHIDEMVYDIGSISRLPLLATTQK